MVGRIEGRYILTASARGMGIAGEGMEMGPVEL